MFIWNLLSWALLQRATRNIDLSEVKGLLLVQLKPLWTSKYLRAVEFRDISISRKARNSLLRRSNATFGYHVLPSRQSCNANYLDWPLGLKVSQLDGPRDCISQSLKPRIWIAHGGGDRGRFFHIQLTSLWPHRDPGFAKIVRASIVSLAMFPARAKHFLWRDTSMKTCV